MRTRLILSLTLIITLILVIAVPLAPSWRETLTTGVASSIEPNCSIELQIPDSIPTTSDAVTGPALVITSSESPALETITIEVNGSNLSLEPKEVTPFGAWTKFIVPLPLDLDSNVIPDGSNNVAATIKCPNGASASTSTSVYADWSAPLVTFLSPVRVQITDSNGVTARFGSPAQIYSGFGDLLKPEPDGTYNLSSLEPGQLLGVADTFGNSRNFQLEPGTSSWLEISNEELSAMAINANKEQIEKLQAAFIAEAPLPEEDPPAIQFSSAPSNISGSGPNCTIPLRIRVPYFRIFGEPALTERNRAAAWADLQHAVQAAPAAIQILSNASTSYGYPGITFTISVELFPLNEHWAGLGHPDFNWRGRIQGRYDASLDRYITSLLWMGADLSYRDQDTIGIWWADSIRPSKIFGFAVNQKGWIGMSGLLRAAERYRSYHLFYYPNADPPLPLFDPPSFAQKDTARILAHEIGHILGLGHDIVGGSSTLMHADDRIISDLGVLEAVVPFEQTRTMIAHLCGNVPLANFKDLYRDRFTNLDAKAGEFTCGNGLVGSNFEVLETCEPENTSSLGQCLDESRPLPQIAAGQICNRSTCQCEGTVGGPSSSSPLPTASAIPSGSITPYTPGSGSSTCGVSAPACDGVCGGGKSCKKQSDGSCKCQKPCGESNAPACSGFCDDGTSCRLTDDGCSCVTLCGAMPASQCGAGWCPGNQPCWDMGQGCTCVPDACSRTEHGTSCAGTCPPGLECGQATGLDLCACAERKILEPHVLGLPGM